MSFPTTFLFSNINLSHFVLREEKSRDVVLLGFGHSSCFVSNDKNDNNSLDDTKKDLLCFVRSLVSISLLSLNLNVSNEISFRQLLLVEKVFSMIQILILSDVTMIYQKVLMIFGCKFCA